MGLFICYCKALCDFICEKRYINEEKKQQDNGEENCFVEKCEKENFSWMQL